MLHELGNHPQLGKPSVWLFQEVSPEAEGLRCCRDHKWTVLAKKGPSEWRGTGIAFHADLISHVDTPTTSEASIGATLYTSMGSKLHVIAAHMPHHATLDHTHRILHDWQAHHPQLHHHPCIIGADWNETFHTANQTATTARGEVILDWLSQQHQHLPHQQDDAPSYHPYNTQMRSRRVDYLSTSRKVLQNTSPVPGSRDYALSDHDAVMSQLTQNGNQASTPNTFKHHPKKLKALGARLPNLPANAHPWDSLVALAANTTGIPQTQIPGKQATQATPPQADVRANPSRPSSATLETHTGSPQARKEKVGPHTSGQSGARRLECLQAKQRQAAADAMGTQADYNHSLATAHDTAL